MFLITPDIYREQTFEQCLVFTLYFLKFNMKKKPSRGSSERAAVRTRKKQNVCLCLVEQTAVLLSVL